MDVFVYGTLTDPERVRRVVSAFEFREAATLDGLHRVDGDYPTLAPGGSVSGRVLRTADVESLDAYEGVESGLYARVAVPRTDEGTAGDGESEVAVYVGDPDRLGADATWPGEGPFPERVGRYVRSESVVIRPR